ncbi:MAG: hypothetical protein ACXQTI_05170, partial [Candidatus Nezhaarchaeales archaeon]
QVVGHSSCKINGTLIVKLEIPEALDRDACLFTVLSLKKAHIRLKVFPYEEEDHKAKKDHKGKREFK